MSMPQDTGKEADMIFCEHCKDKKYNTNGWIDDHEMHNLKVMMARHLRKDHGISRRKTAQTLGLKESFIKRHLEEE